MCIRDSTLGDRKTALFLIMSDTDDSFNFLISMCYTQLFNLLCEKADDVYGGRLPVHVRCLIDEAANIGQIPRLEKLVATIQMCIRDRSTGSIALTGNLSLQGTKEKGIDDYTGCYTCLLYTSIGSCVPL